MPTPDFFGVRTTIITNPNGETGVVTQCRASIPVTATAVQDQNILFDYVIRVREGSNVALAMDLIATRLHRELSGQFLDCRFDDDTTTTKFYTDALTSLPADLVRPEACTAEQAQDEGGDCYVVAAAFVAHVFFGGSNSNTRHRMLQQTEIEGASHPIVIEAFSTAVEEIFDSGSLFAGFSDILGAEYVGTVDPDEESGATPPPAENEAQAVEKGLSPGAKAGVSIGVLLVVFAMVALVLCLLCRDSGDEEKDINDTAESIVIREEGQSIRSQEAENRAMIGDRSLLSDDESYFTNDHDQYHQQAVESKKVYVINDEQSQDGYLNPDTEMERSFEIEEIQTTVQRVESNQYRYGPSRAYGVPDTIDM